MEYELTHGGDWAGFALAHGRPPLDFSANISPLGVPTGVQKALRDAAGRADRYPDPLCRELRAALSAHEGVPAEWILCGNGAADLIFRAVLAQRPRRALVTAPSFGEYEAALRLTDCAVERVFLKEKRNFALDGGFLDAMTPETDMAFLCEPNNPTGVTTSPALLAGILERCRETGTLLVVDECFGDFLDTPEAHSRKGDLAEYPNLLVLRAFTKQYAMAGVRLGYGLCADGDFLERMRRAGQPWPVSSLAQAAGIAALGETDYARRVRELTAEERAWLFRRLTGLGLRVIPGEANYLLFRCPRPLEEPLARRGILLRNCGNYAGLDETWYRAAVRTRTDNRRLMEALEEVLR